MFLVNNGMLYKITWVFGLMHVQECTVHKLYLVMPRIPPMQVEVEDYTILKKHTIRQPGYRTVRPYGTDTVHYGTVPYSLDHCSHLV